ncbi:MAG: dihydrodipicolinate synthase family protein [Kangiellaceae bacterium]|nr:dihydrodipicolinate synthase family protein [Kangiellaceae bacterium]
MSNSSVFTGCIPALMTPCDQSGQPDFQSLATTGQQLIAKGMSAVVYCGSMGDWPLLTIEQRKQGVEALVKAGVPVIVGTGAPSTSSAVELAKHAQDVGAVGLMIIPRLLSRATVVSAQFSHFSAILEAASDLPSVIYNSPYYGYETKADLFFKLRDRHSNLVGFKEFGGEAALTYAAENITSGDENLSLMVGVDTQVVHGFVRCGAQGAITGVGNALPEEILYFSAICHQAATGDAKALGYANELSDALAVLSKFDEEPDLVLYYKHLMVLEGHHEYQYQINNFDALTVAQKAFIETEWKRFRNWWGQWQGKHYLSELSGKPA